MKLENVLSILNSLEKNSFLKIIDTIISNKPKNGKEIDKILSDESKDVAERVETFIHLRNLIGAHYNSWAYTLSTSEAYAFCSTAIDLYRKVYCKSCHTWIENINNDRQFQCKCKSLIIQ